ncbi:hypothetical protein [Luteitalea sp.]
MPTRPGQSRTLLDELLATHDAVAVEAAIARLAIIGRPALRLVVQQLATADQTHLPRLLRVLERIGDPGTLGAIRPLLGHAAPEVAGAAVDAMGALLDARETAVASGALDALTATLLDTSRADVVRVRALEAIASAPERSETYDADVLEPLRDQLRRDPSAALRDAVAAPPPGGEDAAPALDGDACLEAVAAGTLPTAPEVLRQALATHGPDAPLTILHRVIERVRVHERAVAPDLVEGWRVVRAAAHLALAARGSRLAIYDLRESLEVLGEQTPVGMLSALQQVGDASVLDAVAEAWQASDNAWFKGQLTGIFRAVVDREKLTRRHAAVKKITARLPETVAALWG